MKKTTMSNKNNIYKIVFQVHIRFPKAQQTELLNLKEKWLTFENGFTSTPLYHLMNWITKMPESYLEK
jgi:hypothetical protein